MTNPLPLPPTDLLRDRHARSARCWATQGRLEVAAGHWFALTGVTHADFNLAVCHGPQGASQIGHCADVLTSARRPGLLALAGDARKSPGVLRDLRWRLVATAPLMALRLEHRPVARARRLEDDELPLARDLVQRVFGLPPDIAELALTTDPDAVADRSVWGTFDATGLMSCAIAMRVEEAVVIWSMATDSAARRRGHAGDVLTAALTAAHDDGCEVGVLNSTPVGEPFYRSHGFQVVEQWDYWSHPRWVLA